jgi:ATP-dependent Clp protease ATP-binding subunit ClpA
MPIVVIGSPMFSHYGSAARAVIKLAEQECRNANHYFLGTEHILLAMTIDPTPDITAFFHDAHLDRYDVKRALFAAMGDPADHPWDGVLITPRVQKVLAAACERCGGPQAVQPRDIVDAIVEDGGGVAARVLAGLRASLPAR